MTIKKLRSLLEDFDPTAEIACSVIVASVLENDKILYMYRYNKILTVRQGDIDHPVSIEISSM